MRTKAISKIHSKLFAAACLSAIVAGCGQATPTRSEAPIAASPTPTTNPIPTQTAPSPTLTPTPTQAQAPQTAQPLAPPPIDRTKIEFPAGSSSATVEGNLASKEMQQYTFDATADQTAIITITSPNQSVLLTVVTPSGSPIQRYQSGQASWSGTLPETGLYRISAVATEQASPYKVSITIAPKKS